MGGRVRSSRASHSWAGGLLAFTGLPVMGDSVLAVAGVARAQGKAQPEYSASSRSAFDAGLVDVPTRVPRRHCTTVTSATAEWLQEPRKVIHMTSWELS